MFSTYLIGSLRNQQVPELAKELRNELNINVFDDWFSPGPEADDWWKVYSKTKGDSYKDALSGWAARHVFEFDHSHLERCDSAILLLPAGKSCHLELGYMVGRGKPCWILFPEGEPDERWDVMYLFAKLNGGDICFGKEELFNAIRRQIG